MDSDWNWHLWTREEGDSCRSNEGSGSCVHNSTCVGVSYPNEPLCPNDPPEIQCCFVKRCEVPQGQGYCRSEKNNGCPDGEFFAGTGPPWPCVGGNDILCCVKSADMTTATSTATTASTNSTTTDGQGSTGTATSSPEESSGLSGGQIAGITVGVVAAAVLVVFGAVWICIRRRRRRARRTPDVIEAAGQEKVELPNEPQKAKVELPDTGPAFGVAPADTQDDKKDVVASRGNERTPVELPSATNPPQQIERPLVELDASETPTESRKTD